MGNPGILSCLGVPGNGSEPSKNQIPGVRRTQSPPGWEAAAGWEQWELVRAPTAQTGGFFQRVPAGRKCSHCMENVCRGQRRRG